MSDGREGREGRELTFEDVLRYAGAREIHRTREEERARAGRPSEPGGGSGPPAERRSAGEKAGPPVPDGTGLPLAPTGGGCGCGSCGCGGDAASDRPRPEDGMPGTPPPERGGRCAPAGGDAPSAARAPHPPTPEEVEAAGDNTILDKPVDRRGALGMMLGALGVGTQAASACSPASLASEEEREAKLLEWEEYFKGNFRLMTEEEKSETIRRLERLAELRQGVDVSIRADGPIPDVVYGYAFNITKCQGFRNCVQACVEENNLDRETDTQYIRIFEIEDGDSVNDLAHADATFGHAVPAEGHFYLGTQCFQCANPPCVPVCPVQATWQEPDGIVVVDYDWCIGCRYCMAACPYWARRFNWSEPAVPAEELNPRQHYLGNRARRSGCVEKCTFCIQRTREGRLPACAEACPTGARVFGNLLDPDSEIRWVLEHKQVFRLKEELGTEPRFWYFMD